MEHLEAVIEALGEALKNKDFEISTLKWENEGLKKRLEALENSVKIAEGQDDF